MDKRSSLEMLESWAGDFTQVNPQSGRIGAWQDVPVVVAALGEAFCHDGQCAGQRRPVKRVFRHTNKVTGAPMFHSVCGVHARRHKPGLAACKTDRMFDVPDAPCLEVTAA